MRIPLALALLGLAFPGPGATAQVSEAPARVQEARRLKQQGSARAALQVYEALLPGLASAQDRGLYAQALLETGQTALALGEYPRAVERGTQAAGIFHLRADAANEAIAANTVASGELYRGDYNRALEGFQRALQLDRAQLDGKGEITRLSNIGNVYFFQGKYLDALQSYQEALRRIEQTSAESWNAGRRQLVLSNLATLYEQLGQNEKALEYYQQAKASGNALPPDEYAQLLSNTGTLYRRLGDPVKALQTYSAAQSLFAREHHSDGQTHVLQNIGIAYALDIHDMDRALAAFAQALRLAEATNNRRETVLAHLFRGEALFRMGRSEDSGRDFSTAYSGAMEIGAAEEEWTAQYGLGRVYRRKGDLPAALATCNRALATIESVRSALGESSLKSEFLANKRDVYDASIGMLLESGGANTRQLFELFERARSRNLQDALRARMTLPLFQELQARLGGSAILLEYWVGPDRLAVLWVTGESGGVIHRPLSADDVTRIRRTAIALAAARDSGWRGESSLNRSSLSRSALNHSSLSDDMRWLGQLLLGGVPLSNRYTDLLIVPDGILHLLPFEALIGGETPALVMEQYAVSYMPSAALVTARPDSRRPAAPWTRQLVAFGDPLPAAAGALPADRGWGRLPDSGRELRSIGAAVRGRVEIHAGADDRKAFLVSGRAAGVPLLHFSTHAAVDPVDANRSRMLFTPEPGNQGSEYLFWREVPALKLEGVDLVTLSACDTEGGRMVRGEGVQSFSRAFLAAGARSTLTTLWRVADAPTADFMQRFYTHLAKGETKAQALRAAKLSFLNSGTELALPAYWAAFVLNGDGRAPVPAVFSWMWIVVPGLLAIFGVTVLLRRARR